MKKLLAVITGETTDLALLTLGRALGMILLAAATGWLIAGMVTGPDAAHGTIPIDRAFPTALVLVALVIEIAAWLVGRRWVGGRLRTFLDAREAKRQTDELFAMTDMLQSADTYADATAVLHAISKRLLSEYGAALYIFNNSRDRLDLAGHWNLPEGYSTPETLAPSNCWALKRGKPHINDPSSDTLCCAHHASRASSVELPMMARGQVYGLLIYATDRPNAFKALLGMRRLGQALSDSMSLALSNIALREQLRTQSLRDPLTGLYNRRYMEDALERYVGLADRTGGATSLLMIDLDGFKHLNDQHGHAKGDAVLRDVASQLVGGLRPSDVVCRYGGEELLVILPGCDLADAEAKAEMLRLRIAGLSDVHDAVVTASFGVATIPETSVGATELIAQADAALYRAKQAGKNRVFAAEKRANRDDPQLRLAVTG